MATSTDVIPTMNSMATDQMMVTFETRENTSNVKNNLLLVHKLTKLFDQHYIIFRESIFRNIMCTGSYIITCYALEIISINRGSKPHHHIDAFFKNISIIL